MDSDRRKTLMAITIIIAFFILIMITVGLWIAGKGVISPVPPDNAIKIIFISPTPGTGNTGVTPEIRVSPEIIP
jgi:hypothetical protein